MSTRIDTLLPLPFAWVYIPAGKATLTVGDKNSYLKTNTTFDLPAFYISKYPITNAQYAKFIEQADMMRKNGGQKSVGGRVLKGGMSPKMDKNRG